MSNKPSTKSIRKMPTISDDTLLKVSSGGLLAWGAVGLVAHDAPYKAFFVDGSTNHKELSRYWGEGCAMSGMSGLIAARSTDMKAKKDTLKLHGAAWLMCGGLNAYNAYKGTQKKEMGYANAGVSAAIGGLLLTRGLKKD